MKIKHILVMLLIALLPVTVLARDERSVEKLCDNYIFDNIYATYYNSSDNARVFKYLLGIKEKRGIYKDDVVKVCNNGEPCDRAYYGRVDVFGKISPGLNLLTFAIYLNNREVFDTMVKEIPYMQNYLDNALFMKYVNLSNDNFMTPASLLIEEGMAGTLKYLLTKYKDKINLRKISGRFHYSTTKRDPKDNLKRAQDLVEKWKEEGNEDRLFCAQNVLEVVEDWYNNHNDQNTIEEAQKYNELLLKLAKENKVVEVTPFEFTPSLDIFKLQGIEQNFTQNIDRQIDVIIEKIMRDFDLSAFGNHA